ncbi:MAG: DUF6232 family protein [Hyphomicrobiaceae bacterium]
MDISRPPAPWSIELEAERGAQAGMLRLGHRRVPLARIAGLEAGSSVEVNADGHMATVALFLSLAALFVLPVLMNILHPRFLIGGVLFAGIGLSALADILQGHGMTVHRVLIRLADGSTETFASPDPAECRSLVSALEQRLAAGAAGA